MAMTLKAKIDWTDKERTRGKILLLWRCAEHRLQCRADLFAPPPLCPACAGLVPQKRA